MRHKDNKKREALDVMKARLIKAGFRCKGDDCDWLPGLEITDPETDRLFASVSFSQRYSSSPISIRVKHAGMDYKNDRSFEAKQHAMEPFDEWYWSSRRYTIMDSAINAIDKFRSGIPSELVSHLAKLRADRSDSWKDEAIQEREFNRSFSTEQLEYFVGLGGPHCLEEQLESLSELKYARRNARKAELAVERYVEFVKSKEAA